MGDADQRWVYDFADGSREMRDLLGGKGANVAEMTRVLGAERVPAGFTITTEACVAYMKADRTEPEALEAEVREALGRPLAETPSASPRALAQAERAILETLEHHANVRLRSVSTLS